LVAAVVSKLDVLSRSKFVSEECNDSGTSRTQRIVVMGLTVQMSKLTNEQKARYKGQIMDEDVTEFTVCRSEVVKTYEFGCV
jgi:hypothetical protein